MQNMKTLWAAWAVCDVLCTRQFVWLNIERRAALSAGFNHKHTCLYYPYLFRTFLSPLKVFILYLLLALLLFRYTAPLPRSPEDESMPFDLKPPSASSFCRIKTSYTVVVVHKHTEAHIRRVCPI